MKRRKAVLLIALVCISLLAVSFFKKEIWDTNAKLLKGKVLSELVAGDQVKLSEFTPFEWDEVYAFNPYVSKEVIYETIGYKWDRISETVSEGMNQIVFMKDKKVVCYLYGYSENNKFGLFFNGSDSIEDASILYAADHDLFVVEENEGIVYLMESISE